MTVVLVDPDADLRCRPRQRLAPVAEWAGQGPDPVPYPDLVEQARAHRPGAKDMCGACGWHWPCPTYFNASHTLRVGGVPAGWWVA